MKYFAKLLRIFCICVMLPVNNGESNGECPEDSNEACEPCKAKYLNNQIRLKLHQYPELDSPKLGLDKNFNKLRSELSSALIEKPKAKNACVTADNALKSFDEFLLNYHDAKERVEELIKNLIDLEKVVNLSTLDEYEALKLTLKLEDCDTIDAAQKQIRVVKKFLKRFTQPSSDNELKDPNSTNSDKDKTNLQQLLKDVADNLDKLHDKRQQGNDNGDFRNLLKTVIASLENIIKQSAQRNVDKNSLEELIKALTEKVDKLVNQTPTPPPPANNQKAATNPNQVDAHLIESTNTKIRQLCSQYPENRKTSIRLNRIYNEKRKQVLQVMLPPKAKWIQYTLAQVTIQKFTAFVPEYQPISNQLESKILQLQQIEGKFKCMKFARSRAKECIKELQDCDSFEVCLRNLEKNCRPEPTVSSKSPSNQLSAAAPLYIYLRPRWRWH